MFTQYDSKYMGSFFALLQLFGHPHQIIGNNDKWVLNDNIFYPVYRNEGIISPITVEDINSNLIFDNYYYSASLDLYKKILINQDVINTRNLSFKHIIDSSEFLIKSLDSVYQVHKDKHMMANNNFLKIKLNFDYYKRTLLENIITIENYLDSGYTMLYYDGIDLKIKSSRNNKLQIKIGDKTFYLHPKSYGYDEVKKVIFVKNNEIVINNIDNILDIQIVDLILNKTLKIEKDFSILNVN